MTKNNWVDFKTIKSKVSILTLLQDFGVELPSQNGDQLYGPCPLPCHAGDGDNKHAFSVNTEKNCFNCLTSCGGGNAIDLYAHLTNRNPSDKAVFREVALEMQTRYLGNDSPPPQTVLVPAKTSAPKIEVFENKPISITLQVKADIPYLLEEKNLPLDLLKEFGIGFCSKGMFSGRVVLPIHDKDGKCVAYAGRGMKEADITKRGRWLLPKGFSKSLELYNQHRAIQRDIGQYGLVIVEGFWSALHWHQTGFMPVVALMGSELSDEQLQRIAELTDHIWLMLDDDNAGRKATEKILPRLADRVHVRRVQYPDDVNHLQPEDFTPNELRSLIPV